MLRLSLVHLVIVAKRRANCRVEDFLLSGGVGRERVADLKRQGLSRFIIGPVVDEIVVLVEPLADLIVVCLLYTSPSPRD